MFGTNTSSQCTFKVYVRYALVDYFIEALRKLDVGAATTTPLLDHNKKVLSAVAINNMLSNIYINDTADANYDSNEKDKAVYVCKYYNELGSYVNTTECFKGSEVEMYLPIDFYSVIDFVKNNNSLRMIHFKNTYKD